MELQTAQPVLLTISTKLAGIATYRTITFEEFLSFSLSWRKF